MEQNKLLDVKAEEKNKKFLLKRIIPLSAICITLIIVAAVFSAIIIKNTNIIQGSDSKQLATLTQSPDFSTIKSLNAPDNDIYLKTPGAVSDVKETDAGIYLLALCDNSFSVILYNNDGECIWENSITGVPKADSLIAYNNGVYLFTDSKVIYLTADGTALDKGDLPGNIDGISACIFNDTLYYATQKQGGEPAIYRVTENGSEIIPTAWFNSYANGMGNEYPVNLFTDGESLFVYYGYYDIATYNEEENSYPLCNIVKLDKNLQIVASLDRQTSNASSNIKGKLVNGRIYIDIGEADDENGDYCYVLYEFDTNLKLLSSREYGYAAPMDVIAIDDSTVAVNLWLDGGKEISYIDIIGETEKKLYPVITYPEIYCVDDTLYVVGVEGTDNENTDNTDNVAGLVLSYSKDFSEKNIERYTLGDETGWEGRVLFTDNGKRLAIHSSKEIQVVDVDNPEYYYGKGENVVRHKYITHPHIAQLTPHYNADGTYYYGQYPVKHQYANITMYLSRGIELSDGSFVEEIDKNSTVSSDWCFFITAFDGNGGLLYEVSLGKSITDDGLFKLFGNRFVYLDESGYLTGYDSLTGEIVWQHALHSNIDAMPPSVEVLSDADGTYYYATVKNGVPVLDVITIDGDFNVYQVADYFPEGVTISSFEAIPIESEYGCLAMIVSNRCWERINPLDTEGVFIRVVDKDMNVTYSKDFRAKDGTATVNNYGNIIFNPTNKGDTYIYDILGNELLHLNECLMDTIQISETRFIYETYDSLDSADNYLYLVDNNQIINKICYSEFGEWIQNVVPQNNGNILVAVGIHNFMLYTYDENLNLIKSEELQNNDHTIIISADGEITVTANSCH